MSTWSLVPEAVIYALCDPITKEIRYVGKTFNLLHRLKGHFGKDNGKDRRRNWIYSLKSKGCLPEVEILEKIPAGLDSEWKEAERFWISYLRFIGCRLTNHRMGGGCEARALHPVSMETRERMRLARLGRKCSPEAISAMRAASTGRRHSKEARNKIRIARIGTTRSLETCAKISASKKGKIMSDDFCKMMSQKTTAAWQRRKALV